MNFHILRFLIILFLKGPLLYLHDFLKKSDKIALKYPNYIHIMPWDISVYLIAIDLWEMQNNL